jgi:hypothetical protein
MNASGARSPDDGGGDGGGGGVGVGGAGGVVDSRTKAANVHVNAILTDYDRVIHDIMTRTTVVPPSSAVARRRASLDECGPRRSSSPHRRGSPRDWGGEGRGSRSRSRRRRTTTTTATATTTTSNDDDRPDDAVVGTSRSAVPLSRRSVSWCEMHTITTIDDRGGCTTKYRRNEFDALAAALTDLPPLPFSVESSSSSSGRTGGEGGAVPSSSVPMRATRRASSSCESNVRGRGGGRGGGEEEEEGRVPRPEDGGGTDRDAVDVVPTPTRDAAFPQTSSSASSGPSRRPPGEGETTSSTTSLSILPGYVLGQCPVHRWHMVIPTTSEMGIEYAATLRPLDFAFVLRSDGRWVYGIVCESNYNAVRFVLDFRGSTKSVNRKGWGHKIRLINRDHEGRSLR